MSDEVQTTREQREAAMVAVNPLLSDVSRRSPVAVAYIESGVGSDFIFSVEDRVAQAFATREAAAAAWALMGTIAWKDRETKARVEAEAELEAVRAKLSEWRKLAEENQGAAILHDEIGRAVGATGGESVLLAAERVMRERAEARELARVLEVDLRLARRQLADARRQIVLDADRRALSRTISGVIQPSFAQIAVTFNGDIVSGSLEQPDGGDGLPAPSAPSAPSAPADAGAAGDEALVEALVRVVDQDNATCGDDARCIVDGCHAKRRAARAALLSRLASLRARAERAERVLEATTVAAEDDVRRVAADRDAARSALAAAAKARDGSNLTREIDDTICTLLGVARDDYLAAGVEDRPHAPSVAAEVVQQRDAARSALAECQKSLAASGRMVDTWHSRAETHRQAADALWAALSRATERGERMREAIWAARGAWGVVASTRAWAAVADAVQGWDARDAACAGGQP